jgi:hypothetical protein
LLTGWKPPNQSMVRFMRGRVSAIILVVSKLFY